MSFAGALMLSFDFAYCFVCASVEHCRQFVDVLWCQYGSPNCGGCYLTPGLPRWTSWECCVRPLSFVGANDYFGKELKPRPALGSGVIVWHAIIRTEV